MGKLEDSGRGGASPVWVEAILHDDNGVKRVVPLDGEGNEMWEWMMLEAGLALVPRFTHGSGDDTSAIAPDRIEHTTHPLYPPTD